MFFIKRGMAEVVKNGNVIANFGEGDYFGEIALLRDTPRTADVRAVSDCMLLALSQTDLDKVLLLYPMAKERIEAAAAERERVAMKKSPI